MRKIEWVNVLNKMRKSAWRKLRHNEQGQSIVEFALLLPVLLLLLCGTIDFGRILYTYMNMNMATQEAVRLGGLGSGDAEIRAFTLDYLDPADPAAVVVNITPAQASRDSGDYVTVTVSTPYEYMTPVISSILPALTINTDSTIRVE
ncbi:MAG TPA: TadE/TadG family type IV pilus assembly protein [Bacilli bacterium]